jgi:hypothetical protein
MDRFLVLSLMSIIGFSVSAVVVESAADPTDSQGLMTLRQAIQEASDGETITFEESLSGATIRLYGTPGSTGTDTSFMISNKAVSVVGPQGGITLDGGWLWRYASSSDAGGRLFLVTNTTGKVTFRNITFKGGHGRGWYATGEFYQGGAVAAYSPVRFDRCSFVQNGACDEAAFAESGKPRGGGAIYSKSHVELYDCNLVSNVVISGTMSYGGAICMADAGTLTVSNCLFYADRSRSCAGVIYLNNSGEAIFTDTFFLNCDNYGGNGANGGCIWSASNHLSPMTFRRCVFRDCNVLTTSGLAGAIFSENAPMLVDSCEFTRCSAQCGGAIRFAGRSVFVKTTFAECSAGSWGGQVDARTDGFYINCTFTGGYAAAEDRNGGGLVRISGRATLLNTVLAYNYHKPLLIMNADFGNYGGSQTVINSIFNQVGADGVALTLATNLVGISSAARLFASYRESNSLLLYGSSCVLARSVVFPEREVQKEGRPDRPLVVPIEKSGLLEGTGYPVKANADYSYVAYSADGGTTWTDLFGTDDGTAELIAADQRGIPYYRGWTPIGAATFVPGTGLILLVR